MPLVGDGMTLTEFLLARIAEDEAAAREQTATTQSGIALEWERDVDYGERYLTIDPARVLAECEAKRRIMEALIDAEAAVATYDTDDPNNPPSYWQEWGNLHALRLAAELLALPYADHPDFDPGWKP